MVQINFALKEVNCKVVYYGPGLSGKTTNLEVVHNKAPKTNVGELTSIATEGDRTLFFDFLPLNLGKVAGMQTKFQIYTVPGQVYYNSTRKLVLQGSDGIVFVADSRRGKMEENLESLKNLEENLEEYGMDIDTIPLVIQYNKRDLDDIHTVEELEKLINRFDAPCFEAVAVTGEGVFPTLKKLSSMVLEHLNSQHGSARIKTKTKRPVSVREPALATAGGSQRQSARAPSSAKPSRAPSGKARPPGSKGTGGRPAPRKQGGRVLRDKVAAGVRPIERKAPPQLNASVKRRPQVVRAKSGGKKGVLVVVILAVLAAAGAAVYFSGVWKRFL